MSSEILVKLKCDSFDINGAKVTDCNETVIVTECLIFIAYNEYTNEPYAALEYLMPNGWLRTPEKSHFCPRHAEKKKKEKYSLPNFQAFDNNDSHEVHEEPTRKIKTLKPEKDSNEPNL